MDPRDCCKKEQLKFALYNQFRVPKLFRFAEQGDWDKIPKRTITHRHEAKFVHAFPPSDTALHRVLRTPTGSQELEYGDQVHIKNIQIEAVKSLINAHPEAASTRDAFGRTPLHVACMDIMSCGDEIATLILESFPSAAGFLDDVEGRTPLHYLVGRGKDIPIGFLEKLITAHPKSLMVADQVGETPSQIAKQRDNEISNAEAVMGLLKS